MGMDKNKIGIPSLIKSTSLRHMVLIKNKQLKKLQGNNNINTDKKDNESESNVSTPSITNKKKNTKREK